MKVKEFANVVNGATPSSKHPEYYDGDIVWFTPKDLSDQKTKYVFSGERKITKEGFDSCSTKMLPANSLLMSSRAPIGLLAITKVPCCTNQGFKSFEINAKKCNPEYLYYYIKFHIKEIEALGSGTTFKEVSKESMEEYDVALPSIEEQNKIVSILSDIDSKIANNNAICADLENMAKLLYDYWFVQFDFPDENGKPYKSSGGKMVWNDELKREIPAGWEVKQLSDVLALLKDGTHNPPARVPNGIPLLTGTMFGDTFLNYSQATYITHEDYQIIHSQYQPQAGDIILTKIGTIGNVNYLRNIDIPIAIHCNSALLRFPTEYAGPFAFLYCKSSEFFVRLKAVKGQSIQEFCSLDSIGSVLMLMPANDIVCRFNNEAQKYLDECEILTAENNQLASLRDFLLPMLMNGQVKVGVADSVENK